MRRNGIVIAVSLALLVVSPQAWSQEERDSVAPVVEVPPCLVLIETTPWTCERAASEFAIEDVLITGSGVLGYMVNAELGSTDQAYNPDAPDQPSETALGFGAGEAPYFHTTATPSSTRAFGAEYMDSYPCKSSGPHSYTYGTNTKYKPDHVINPDFKFRLWKQHASHVVTDKDWRMYFASNAIWGTYKSDVNDMIEWAPGQMQKVGNPTTWSIGVERGGFGANASWDVYPAKAGGVPHKDGNEHASGWSGETKDARETKGLTIWKIRKAVDPSFKGRCGNIVSKP